MPATVPSCGATTGISIFIASRITIASPAFTACPTLASTLNTLPGTEAFTSIAPAAAAGFAAAGAALGAAFGAAFGAAAGAPFPAFSSTVTSYATPFTVIV